jgi:hypothetical protein
MAATFIGHLRLMVKKNILLGHLLCPADLAHDRKKQWSDITKVPLEQNVSLFRRYGKILTYMFLDVVLHEDSENGIKIWNK